LLQFGPAYTISGGVRASLIQERPEIFSNYVGLRGQYQIDLQHSKSFCLEAEDACQSPGKWKDVKKNRAIFIFTKG
jgi:hypothetical protein